MQTKNTESVSLNEQLLLSLGGALEHMDGTEMVATERSIPGHLVLLDGRPVQVFVKLYWFDPETGEQVTD